MSSSMDTVPLRGDDAEKSKPQQWTAYRQMLYRSAVAVAILCGIIIVLSWLPRGYHPELRHLLVLHRHGERSSISWYDFEGDWPWAPDDVAIGKLTVHGMKEGFYLGQQLRVQYDDFISFDGEVPMDKVSIVSTDVDRTIDTGHSVLLGLFSEPFTMPKTLGPRCACRPDHGARADVVCIAECLGLASVPRTPPITVRNNSEDIVLQQSGLCQGWREWRAEVEQSVHWQRLPEMKFKAGLDAVGSIIGDRKVVKKLKWPSEECEAEVNVTQADLNRMAFMESVWGNLRCFEAHGTRYSDAADNQELLKSLQPSTDYIWHDRYASDHGRLTGGILLNEWLEKLQATAAALLGLDPVSGGRRLQMSREPPTTAKIDIYSAHDTTVFSLLAALGAAETSPLPPFGAHVTFELWQTRLEPRGFQDFEVRIFYDDEQVDSAINCAGCEGGICSLKTLLTGCDKGRMSPEDCKRPEASVIHEDQRSWVPCTM